LICAQRERWQKPDARLPYLKVTEDPPLPLLSGSRELPEVRTQEDVKNGVKVYACGICGEHHRAAPVYNDSGAAYCDWCREWSVLVLRAGQYAEPSTERDEIYAKLKRVREAMREGSLGVTAGSEMSFWTLAKRWGEHYRRTNEVSSWGVYLSYYKHLILYFESKAISEISHEEVDRFKEYLLSGTGRRAPFKRTTVVKIEEMLRRIFKYAKGEGWVTKIPFERGAITRAHRMAQKKTHGGARNVKWTPQREDEFLTRYEEALRKIKAKDLSLPQEVVVALLLPGNSASDVARDYVAQQMGVESNDYLRTLLTRARKRRKQIALHSSPT
jgi:hypothetical protein